MGCVSGGGWVREIENKAKLSPAGAGDWAEHGKSQFVPLTVANSIVITQPHACPIAIKSDKAVVVYSNLSPGTESVCRCTGTRRPCWQCDCVGTCAPQRGFLPLRGEARPGLCKGGGRGQSQLMVTK